MLQRLLTQIELNYSFPGFEMNDLMDQGRLSADVGLETYDNPYENDTLNHARWAKGWKQGERLPLPSRLVLLAIATAVEEDDSTVAYDYGEQAIGRYPLRPSDYGFQDDELHAKYVKCLLDRGYIELVHLPTQAHAEVMEARYRPTDPGWIAARITAAAMYLLQCE